VNFVPLRSSALLENPAVTNGSVINGAVTNPAVKNHGWNPGQCLTNRVWLVTALLCSSLLLLAAPRAGVAQASPQTAPAPESVEATHGGEYSLLFVNPQQGNDRQTGSESAPFKTITHALNSAAPNTLIVLAAGLYSSETGEAFPLQLKPGVTLQGEARDRGQSVVIRGSGFFLSKSFARQKVAIVGANRAGLRGVTVTNPESQGYGLWIESSSPVISDNTFTGSSHDGISIVGNSAPILRNNYFYNNGANGLTIYGTSRPELRDNIVERTGFGINIAQNAAPRLIGNRITQNKDGIVVQGNAQPILRSNVIDGNERDGLVAIGNARPDLGSRDDQGNNAFLNNAQSDLNAQASSQIIPAAGNQITASRGRIDVNAVAVIPSAPPANQARSLPLAPIASVAPSATTPVPTSRLPIAPSTPVQPATLQPIARQPASRAVAQPERPNVDRPNTDLPNTESRVIPIPVPVPASNTQTRSPIAPAVDPISTPTPEPGAREITFSRPAVDRSTSPATLRSSVNLPTPRQAWTKPTIDAPTPIPAAIATPTPNPSPLTGRNLAIPSESNSESSPASAIAQPGQEVLPVPGSRIPLGNVGEMPSVPVWRNNRAAAVGGNPPIPPTRSGAAPTIVRYRVLVDLSDEASLRSIVPNAFTTVAGGRSMLQAGAFGDRAKAEELLQTLVDRSIRATLEQF
jgi:parallel beta-helix repeat protein